MGRSRALVVLATLVVVPLAVLVAALVAGVTIDASRWRDALAQRASAALGRPVALQGALQLTLGRELVLRIGKVQVGNPAGFVGQDFLAVGEARLRVDLFDALRGQPRLRGVEASDVGLWLERAADGRGNWASGSLPYVAGPQPAFSVRQIALHRLAVHYRDERSATQRSVEVDELSGNAGSHDPLQLALRGRIDGQFAYLLKLQGGALGSLQDAREPWPITLDFKSSGASLHAAGVLDAGQGEARFHVGASAEDLARIGPLLGTPLPKLGVLAVHGSVVARAGSIEFKQVQGMFGESAFSGQFGLAFGGARPRLSGGLSIEALDLRPFFAADAQAQGRRADGDAPAWPALVLRDLVPMDLELDLSVDRWLGLPLRIRDAKLALRADVHGLRAPLSATLAGVALHGRLDLDTAAPTPKFALQFAAQDLALGGLARDLAGVQGVEGRLGHASLRVGGRGETLGDMLRELELSFTAAAGQISYHRTGDARPIAITLDTLELGAGGSERLHGHARGLLQGQRARLSLRGGSVSDMLAERSAPIEIELALAEATLRMQAAFGGAQATPDTAVRFDLQARRSGDLARWLPVAPQSDLPLAVRGRVRLAQDAWQLDDTTLQLGRSRLSIDAHRTRAAGSPLTIASVRSTLIDVPELLTLRADADADAGAPARPGARIDAPLLSDAIDLADADLDLDLRHVWLGRTDLVDLSWVARMRQGRLLPSQIKGTLAGAPFNALVELDLGGPVPAARLDLSTGAIDVGLLLRELGVAEDIDARVDALQLALQGRGNSLRELAGRTTLEARLVGGNVTVLGAAQRPVAEIRLREAILGAAAGQPLRLRLDGTLDQTPVRLQASSGSVADFVGQTRRQPFVMAAQAAGTRLSLEGEVTLPLGSAGQLSFEMGGERLDTLSELARVELPAWGPWSIRGPIRITPGGYALQELQVGVGQSRLSGSGTLDLSGPRPRLDVQVAAQSIQLDDFPLPPRLTDAPPQPGQGDGLRGMASRLAGQTDRLLSARFLRRFDANIDVHAQEVLSGVDRLADGEVHLKLKDGRLDMNPAVINLPGGGMRLSIAYDLKESEVDFTMAAYVERFDYGIIARRLNRADDLRGLFSLNLELAGTAPSLDSIMRNANGRFDFAVWPTELRSGVFNLWSANLVLTLLPLIDPGVKSQVNCIVGRFDLKDGRLSDDKLIIDTTALRIRGAGYADLRTEQLGFVFRPRAKGFAMFRLQTPLRVSGTLDDQRFGIERRDTVESVLRLIAAPVLFPLEWLSQGPLPRDGADVCSDPLRAAGR